MKYISIFIILFCFACRSPSSQGDEMKGKPMASFNLLLMDSVTRLNTNDVPLGEPIVMIFISPYCPYCKAQIEDILSNIHMFSHVKLYIFTTLPFSAMREYVDYYKLDKYKNITVGQNSDSHFVEYFKVSSIPYTVIYSKDKILKDILIGKVDADVIRDIAFR